MHCFSSRRFKARQYLFMSGRQALRITLRSARVGTASAGPKTVRDASMHSASLPIIRDQPKRRIRRRRIACIIDNPTAPKAAAKPARVQGVEVGTS